MLSDMTATPPPPRLALVGDRSTNAADGTPAVRAHGRIPTILTALSADRDPIEPYWLHSTSITGPDDLAGFDGVWVIPGSPYEHTDGVLTAITAARTGGIPFLGTCGGFQHMLIEFAREVCGLTNVDHAELHPDAAECLIVPLECSLLGEEAPVAVVPGTRAAAAMGAGISTERYFCRYGLDRAYLDRLLAHGLVVSGHDAQGDVRIAELPGDTFFLGSLFQPELASDASWVHPLLVAFADAVRAHAAAPTGAVRAG